VLVCTWITICFLRDHGKKKVGSISSSNKVHGVVNDNSNHYRIMVMDAIRMNQGDAGECSIIDEE